jgi:ElaB/YqjD/DUF883 family membrane-anchored ribosome-binding protein
MRSSFSEMRDDAVNELETQIMKLRRDVAALSKEASRRGSRRLDEAGDGASDAWNAFVKALSKTSSNAYEGGRDQAADAYAAFVKAISKHGSRAYDKTRENASDIYDEMMERGAEAGRQLAKQARYAGRRASNTARENPVATVVAIGVVGLLASLLLRRSGD